MQRYPGLLRTKTAAFLMTLCSLAGQAAAQSQRLRPPENNSGINGMPWRTGLVMLLLVAIVGIAAFLKSKRGHQD